MTTQSQSLILTQIKHMDGSMLYECEAPAGTPNPLRYALEKAVREGANLAGANLRGVNLEGAYLAGANLAGANLTGVNLMRANLTRAYLEGSILAGAIFRGVNLTGANLTRTYLAGTIFEGAYLLCKGIELALTTSRPILCVGPVGSRGSYVTFYLTDKGVYVGTGCFFGSMDEFKTRLYETHEVVSGYREEYEGAILMVENKAKIRM